MSELQYYQNNPNLKKKGCIEEFTTEQLNEIYRCSIDPIYFIKNYINIISLDDGLIKFKLFDFQEEFVNLLHNEKRIIAKLGRQSGKCLEKLSELVLLDEHNNEYSSSIEDLFNEFP